MNIQQLSGTDFEKAYSAILPKTENNNIILQIKSIRYPRSMEYAIVTYRVSLKKGEVAQSQP
jgi:hypothetical protein